MAARASAASAFRRLLLLLVAAGAGAGVASAASLAVTSNTLGAGSLSTPRCTTAGLTVFQNLTLSNVVSVVVGNLPAGCAGATLQLTVDNGLTSSGGSATVPAGGGSVTVTLGVAVAMTASERTDLVLVGP